MRREREIPDVTRKQTVAYYTFVPMLIVVFGTAVAVLPLSFYGVIELHVAIALQWACLAVCCGWVSAFGEGVIPAATYRKRRENKWWHIRKDDYSHIAANTDK